MAEHLVLFAAAAAQRKLCQEPKPLRRREGVRSSWTQAWASGGPPAGLPKLPSWITLFHLPTGYGAGTLALLEGCLRHSGRFFPLHPLNLGVCPGALERRGREAESSGLLSPPGQERVGKVSSGAPASCQRCSGKAEWWQKASDLILLLLFHLQNGTLPAS